MFTRLIFMNPFHVARAAMVGLSLFTGGGAPPPPRTDADPSPRIHCPRIGMAAGATSFTGAGPLRRCASEFSRSLARPGFTALASGWPQALHLYATALSAD